MRLFNDKLSQYIWYVFTETQYEVQRNVNGVKDRAETLRVAKLATKKTKRPERPQQATKLLGR